MLSVYSGMDMNFTQSFPTPFGLARSRVTSFDSLPLPPQQQQQQQQQQHSLYSSSSLSSSSVSLVEPTMQSDVSMTTATSSAPNMYYPAYPSPFVPSNNMVTSAPIVHSADSSPSMGKPWNYTSSTEVLPDSCTHSFEAPNQQQQQQQQYMYSQDNTSHLPAHQHDDHSYAAPSSMQSPVSTHTYDQTLSYQVPSGFYPYRPNCPASMHSVGDDPSASSPQASAFPVALNSPAPSIDQQQSFKRQRVQSSPLTYSKQGRSPSSSPLSYSGMGQPPSHHSHHHHHHYNETSQSVSIGSSSPLSDHGSTSGSYPSMNMISTFPTKVNISANSSPKRYECHICAKKFTRPSSLTTHIYSHTGEKPFQCPVEGCGRYFSVVSNLRRHAKIHMNGMGSKC